MYERLSIRDNSPARVTNRFQNNSEKLTKNCNYKPAKFIIHRFSTKYNFFKLFFKKNYRKYLIICVH